MNRLVVAIAILVALWTSAIGAQTFNSDPTIDALEGVELRDRASTEYLDILNLLVERGRVAPAQNLLSLDTVKEVRLRIEGPAQFTYHSPDRGDVFLKEVSYRADKVSLPQVVAGEDHSLLYVEVEGEEPWHPIMIGIVNAGHIRQEIIGGPVILRPLIIRADAEAGYAILDFARREQAQGETEFLRDGIGRMEICVYYGLDGLYRDSWGCNTAFKIPNNTPAVGLAVESDRRGHGLLQCRLMLSRSLGHSSWSLLHVLQDRARRPAGLARLPPLVPLGVAFHQTLGHRPDQTPRSACLVAGQVALTPACMAAVLACGGSSLIPLGSCVDFFENCLPNSQNHFGGCSGKGTPH